LDLVAGRLEAEVAVVRGGAVDHRVPRSRPMADQLQRGDRQVTVRGLRRLEDLEHVPWVVIEVLENRLERPDVDALEMGVGRVGDGPAGPSQRALVAPFAVRLGRTPVDVEATLRVEPTHVDALDGAGLGALEARLALDRAVFVVEELEPAAELVGDVETHLAATERLH